MTNVTRLAPHAKLDKPIGKAVGWVRRATRYLFESGWYHLRQDEVEFADRSLTYTYIDHPGAVFVVPVTPAGQIVVLRTYRYTVDEWCWEVPAGGIGDKSGASLEEVARAEMLEESGCSGGTLEYLGWYYSANGAANLKVHYYLARDVKFGDARAPEHAESIDEVRCLDLAEAFEWAYSGKMRDGDSVLALLLAAKKLG